MVQEHRPTLISECRPFLFPPPRLGVKLERDFQMAEQPNSPAAPAESNTPATPEPATTPAPEAPTTPAAAQNTEPTAPETPATPEPQADQHMIPKTRFDEINTKFKEAEKRLKEIEKAEAEAKKKQAEAEEAAAKEQGKWKELYEAQQAKLTEIEAAKTQAEAEAKAAQLKALRIQVAAANGLPKQWHDRLRGETEEEITADAQMLAETMGKPPIHTQTDAGAGTNNRTPTPEMSDAELAERAAQIGVSVEHLKRVYEQRRIQQQ